MWQIISPLLQACKIFSLSFKSLIVVISRCNLSPSYLKPFRLLDVLHILPSNLDVLAIISPNMLSASFLSFSLLLFQKAYIGPLGWSPQISLGSLPFYSIFFFFPLLSYLHVDWHLFWLIKSLLNLASEFLFLAITFLALELFYLVYFYILLFLYW